MSVEDKKLIKLISEFDRLREELKGLFFDLDVALSDNDYTKYQIKSRLGRVNENLMFLSFIFDLINLTIERIRYAKESKNIASKLID